MRTFFERFGLLIVPIILTFRLTLSAELLAVQANSYVFDLYTPGPTAITHLAYLWSINGVVSATSHVSSCFGYTILGGYSVLHLGDTIERTYSSLVSHSTVYYSVTIMAIDNWQLGQYLKIKLDNQVVLTVQPKEIITAQGSLNCGGSQADAKFKVVGVLPHSASSITISISSDQSATDAYYGIFDVLMRISEDTGTTQSACYTPTVAAGNSISYACNCLEDQYRASDGTCKSCDAHCANCFGSSAGECYGCAVNSGFDVTYNTCFDCSSGCFICSGPGENQCDQCAAGKFLYWDNTCHSICPSPYITTAATLQICTTPCEATNTYMLPDNTCTSTCDSPMVASVEGDALFCDSPCDSSTDYLYWDGTCESTCTNTIRIADGTQFCDACATGYFMYPNGSCLSSCTSPYTQTTIGGSAFCVAPCPASAPYYSLQDGSCQQTCNSPYQIVDSAFCTLGLSASTVEEVYTMAGALGNVSSASTVVRITLSLLNPTNPAAIFIQMFLDMLQYIKYMNLNFPEKMEYLFQLKMDLPITIIPDDLFDFIYDQIPEQTLPGRFALDTSLDSSFLVNFGNTMMVFIGIDILLVVVIIGEHVFRSFKTLHKLFSYAKSTLKWNFILTFFISHYGDIILYSGLEFQFANPTTPLEILSFVSCSLCNLVICLIFPVGASAILKSWTLKKQEQEHIELDSERVSLLKKKLAQVQIFYDGYKAESLHQYAFMYIFVGRIVLFVATIVYLSNYPFAQAIIVVLLSSLMLLYLLVSRPIESRLDLIQNILQEITILVAKSCVLILAVLDFKNWENSNLREILGDIYIYCNLALSAISVVYLLIQAMCTIWNIFKFLIHKGWRKSSRARGSVSVSISVSSARRQNPTNMPESLRQRRQQETHVVMKSCFPERVRVRSKMNDSSFRAEENSRSFEQNQSTTAMVNLNSTFNSSLFPQEVTIVESSRGAHFRRSRKK